MCAFLRTSFRSSSVGNASGAGKHAARPCVALLIAICTCTPARAQSWVAAPAFPDHTQGREFAIGMLYQGKLLAVGGTPWMNGQDMDGAVHSLDPPYAGSWQEATPLAGMGPVIHQGGGIDGLGRIIIFGGVNIDNGDPGENVVYDLIEGPKGKIAARGALAPDDNFAYCTDAQNRLYSIGGGPGRRRCTTAAGTFWRWGATDRTARTA